MLRKQKLSPSKNSLIKQLKQSKTLRLSKRVLYLQVRLQSHLRQLPNFTQGRKYTTRIMSAQLTTFLQTLAKSQWHVSEAASAVDLRSLVRSMESPFAIFKEVFLTVAFTRKT